MKQIDKTHVKMNGGILPVYAGKRYQRGGGILSSIARFVLPTAKKMLTETVKVAPRVVDAVVNEEQSVGKSMLQGLKTARANTAHDTINRMGIKPRQSAARKRSRPHRKSLSSRKRHKPDIFS